MRTLVSVFVTKEKEWQGKVSDGSGNMVPAMRSWAGVQLGYFLTGTRPQFSLAAHLILCDDNNP